MIKKAQSVGLLNTKIPTEYGKICSIYDLKKSVPSIIYSFMNYYNSEKTTLDAYP